MNSERNLRTKQYPTCLVVVGLVSAVALCGCRFDPRARVGDFPGLDGQVDAAFGDAAHGDGAVVDGRVDALVDAGPCEDGQKRCSNGTLEICRSGSWDLVTTCLLGCRANGLSCKQILPSNGLDPRWMADPNVGDVTFDQNVVLNSDDGTIRAGGVVVGGLRYVFHSTSQSGDCGGSPPPGIGGFVFGSLTVNEGVTVRIVGGNVVALMARDSVEIHGTVDVSGGVSACPDHEPWCGGPGGFAGGRSATVDPQPGLGPGAGGPGHSESLGWGDETGGGGGGYGGGGG
ncbi:MAG: hypothetical protein J7M25_09620, partial [Deltaproteobacteria bacterium]|nr:hypothetical protein [Deltaproteobacteria bacterium]